MPAAKHPGFRSAAWPSCEAEIIQPYRPEFAQLAGYVRGGILGALADFAGGAAAGNLLPEGWMNMTVDYTVKILAPAQGEQVVARGRVLKAGRHVTVATVDVLAGDAGREALSATALVTMQNRPIAA